MREDTYDRDEVYGGVWRTRWRVRKKQSNVRSHSEGSMHERSRRNLMSRESRINKVLKHKGGYNDSQKDKSTHTGWGSWMARSRRNLFLHEQQWNQMRHQRHIVRFKGGHFLFSYSMSLSPCYFIFCI